MGKRERNKGSGGEREFFKLLSLHLGVEVKRKLGQAREGGHDGEYGPLIIEVKRRKGFSVARHLDQARLACSDETKVPIVALREDHGPWMILLTADSFFKLTKDSKLLTGGEIHVKE